MSSLSEKLELALMTLQDKLTFGLDESQAVYRREARVRGVLVDAVKEVKKLQTENAKLRECVEFYADYRNHGFPSDAEISDYEKDKLSFFKQGKRARQVLKELDEK